VSRVKDARQEQDPHKRDRSPAVLDFGPVRFILSRHFGFCYGVKNAVEIAYKTLDAHADRRIFFLSEMIHNPTVNNDLSERGVRFIFTPRGEQLVPWEELTPRDIVVVPAFGTTLEKEEELAARGIDPYEYNTTCPFVEKVWKRSAELGKKAYTVVVHGKADHEETRATFSHSARNAPTVIILHPDEARVLGDIIRRTRGAEAFTEYFGDKCSEGFDPREHLSRIGVVNQTTMLATETKEITRVLYQALTDRYGENEAESRFADTSDTLCYATNENQNATYALNERGADLALVVGGYLSSNTGHIAALCEQAMPTFFIQDANEIISRNEIRHYLPKDREITTTNAWLPEKRPVDVALTSGASCPDSDLETVLLRVLSFFEATKSVEVVLKEYPEIA
jgi:4-hydroxy-3-methylbut-2-enyl diphosphate reductase